jgi:hypothetical protein
MLVPQTGDTGSIPVRGTLLRRVAQRERTRFGAVRLRVRIPPRRLARGSASKRPAGAGNDLGVAQPGLERTLREREAGGSNPLTRTRGAPCGRETGQLAQLEEQLVDTQ